MIFKANQTLFQATLNWDYFIWLCWVWWINGGDNHDLGDKIDSLFFIWIKISKFICNTYRNDIYLFKYRIYY